MPKALISVVIPTYNSSQFITKTLDSLKVQTFKNFEVIVINDGSRDKTEERILKYISSNPDLSIKLINQTNKGIAGARNMGVKKSQAQYIAFLDHDDAWYPEKLEKSYRILLAQPEVSVVCHDEYMRDVANANKIIRRLRYGPYVKNMFRKLLFKGNCLSTSAVVIRKEAILETGLFNERPEYSTVEDYDLWMRISKKHRIYFLSEVLGEYIINDRNASLNYEMHYNNQIKALRENFKEYSQRKVFDFLLIRLRIAIIYMILSCTLLKNRRFLVAVDYIVKAILQLFSYV